MNQVIRYKIIKKRRVVKLIAATLALAGAAHSQDRVRVETITYHDNTQKWSLGQIASTEVNGVIVNRTLFDSETARPIQTSSFGRLGEVLTYNSDGTVESITDARNNTTILSGWKRGIPQAVNYADNLSVNAVVDDNGWVSSVIDQNGYETNYSYDVMGRLNGVIYPVADSTTWAPVSQAFSQIQFSEHGIPAGHWRLTKTIGRYSKTTYFDALWRPILSSEHDANDVINTQRFIGYEYDYKGRISFTSYPAANSNTDQGVWTFYDVIGRPIETSQDSEHGLLTTTTSYGSDASGAYTLVRQPRGNEVRTWYQTFGEPSYSTPIKLEQPGGVITTISRDIFGKPSSITRASSDGTSHISRYYNYNAHQELCAAVEPETGTTLFGYDEAGNLAWSAAGLTDISTCQNDGSDSSVASRLVSRSYDNRNRIIALTFPDGNGNQTWQYTPDGMPSEVVTQDVSSATHAVNTYTYNKRRLLTSETSAQRNGYYRVVGYDYDVVGALAGVRYPSGLYVDYAPNGLGQPTRAGSYALGVTYHPNGGVKQFTYGNGIIHTMQQNVRQLPGRVVDASVVDNSYSYDKNANVIRINDALDPSRMRTMEYDSLDRLIEVISPSFGGNGNVAYNYDALDNITSVNFAGIRSNNYIYDSSNRLRNILNGAGATIVGFAYDLQGNVSNKNGRAFQYDYGNRMRSVAGEETYRYDGNGRRTVSWSPVLGNIISTYGHDGVLRRLDDDRKAKIVEYVYLNGSLVAKVSTSTAPSAPTVTAPAYSEDGSYAVSWISVPTATSYTVQEQYNAGEWRNIHTGPGLTRVETGKQDGIYGYRARACRNIHCGDWSSIIYVSVLTPPAGKSIITGPSVSNNGDYTLSWTSISGAQTYKIEESSTGAAWAQINDIPTLSLSLKSKAIGTYYYRVKACNSAGCGNASSVISVRVVYPPSIAPILSGPAKSSDGDYVISWAAISAATTYSLEESTSGVAWKAISTSSNTGYEVKNKSNGSYAYRSRACNDGGCSNYSSIITTTVLHPPVGTIALNKQQVNQNNKFTVEWGAVATATSYRLEESYNNSNWSSIYNGGATSNIFSGKGNGEYKYRVQACNESGCTVWSPILIVTVGVAPQPPAQALAKIEQVSRKEWSITVSWNSVPGATSYELRGLLNWIGPATSFSEIWESYSSPIDGANFEVRACNTYGCSGWFHIFNVVEG